MNEDRDIVLFRIDRKVGLLMLAALAVIFGGFALAQQLTLTTSYPVPSGVYNQLTTTGNSGAVPANTTFNLNAGNTILVPPTNASGNVGIGTLTPASKLSVAGAVQLGNDAAACTAAKAGTLIWSGSLQFCNGSTWVAAQTPEPPTFSYNGPFNIPGITGRLYLFTKGAGATSLSGAQIRTWPYPGMPLNSVVCSNNSSGPINGLTSIWCVATIDAEIASVVQDGVTFTWAIALPYDFMDPYYPFYLYYPY